MVGVNHEVVEKAWADGKFGALLSVAYSGQRKAGIDELANNILNFGRVDSVALTRPAIS